jgi:hypothetical protein
LKIYWEQAGLCPVAQWESFFSSKYSETLPPAIFQSSGRTDFSGPFLRNPPAIIFNRKRINFFNGKTEVSVRDGIADASTVTPRQ